MKALKVASAVTFAVLFVGALCVGFAANRAPTHCQQRQQGVIECRQQVELRWAALHEEAP